MSVDCRLQSREFCNVVAYSRPLRSYWSLRFGSETRRCGISATLPVVQNQRRANQPCSTGSIVGAAEKKSSSKDHVRS